MSRPGLRVRMVLGLAIVIKDLGVKQDLPLDKAVTVAFKADKKGKLRYACPMDMIAGNIIVD